MSNYDAWLEEPYQRHYAEADAFITWCEDNDRDPDEDGLWDEYQAYIEEAEADYLIERAESMREEEEYWRSHEDY